MGIISNARNFHSAVAATAVAVTPQTTRASTRSLALTHEVQKRQQNNRESRETFARTLSHPFVLILYTIEGIARQQKKKK